MTKLRATVVLKTRLCEWYSGGLRLFSIPPPPTLCPLNRKLESLWSPREKNLKFVEIDSFSTNDSAKSLSSEAQQPLPRIGHSRSGSREGLRGYELGRASLCLSGCASWTTALGYKDGDVFSEFKAFPQFKCSFPHASVQRLHSVVQKADFES